MNENESDSKEGPKHPQEPNIKKHSLKASDDLFDIIRGWLNFLKRILDPWVALSLGGSILLIYLSTNPKYSSASAVLSIFATIASSIAGGLISHSMHTATEHRVVAARGESSIRGLKLLLLNLNALSDRIYEIIKLCSNRNDFDVLNAYLSEIINRCKILEEEAISSIENWTDIIPEANVRSQIGAISSLHKKLEGKMSELELLKNSHRESDQDKLKLENEVKKRIAEIANLKRELSEKEIQMTHLGVPQGSGFGDLTSTFQEVASSDNQKSFWISDYKFPDVIPKPQYHSPQSPHQPEQDQEP